MSVTFSSQHHSQSLCGPEARAFQCATDLARRILRGSSAYLLSFDDPCGAVLSCAGIDDPIAMAGSAIDVGQRVLRSSAPFIASGVDGQTGGFAANWIGLNVSLRQAKVAVLCVADAASRAFDTEDMARLQAIADDLAQREGSAAPAPLHALLHLARTMLRAPAEGSSDQMREAAEALESVAHRLRENIARVASEAHGPDGVESRASSRILLADDLDLNRKLIADMLSLEGHVVDCVRDGAAAVRAVTSTRYDLVLMDVIMPDMDGLAATRAIRALPKPASDVPILGLTANAYREHLDTCLESGMDGVVGKPMSIDTLSQAVAQWTRQRHAAA